MSVKGGGNVMEETDPLGLDHVSDPHRAPWASGLIKSIGLDLSALLIHFSFLILIHSIHSVYDVTTIATGTLLCLPQKEGEFVRENLRKGKPSKIDHQI